MCSVAVIDYIFLIAPTWLEIQMTSGSLHIIQKYYLIIEHIANHVALIAQRTKKSIFFICCHFQINMLIFFCEGFELFVVCLYMDNLLQKTCF